MSQVIIVSDIPAQCLGETGALSFKPPTEQDLKNSSALEEALTLMNIFETPEEILQRRQALIKLQEISNNWIYKKALEQNLPEHNAATTTGKIFTFGSYRLGVNFRGADIDSLLVVPRFITRDEFFTEFQSILADEEFVEDMHAVPDAFVPVLKLKFKGVEIDLLFAQVDMMSVKGDFNLSENSEQLLRNMDERDVRSVNGVRVTEDILNLVYPKDVFKTALKVIRLWAKRKNIYSNAIGFLGGVSWAILTCRICQLYPCASPSTIVHLFFTIFSQWPWPKPVRLRESEFIPSLSLPVWDPRRNPPDQYHLMPILTPSYPSQNSTYNVQRSNRIIIEQEIKRGLNVVKDILLKKRPWADLFEPTFFFTYRHYVVVIVTGDDKRAFVERCGLVESRLRVLVSNAESNRYVKLAHVNCRAYGRGPQDGESVAHVKKWFIGMEFDRNPSVSTTTTLLNTTAATPGSAPLSDHEKSQPPAPKLNIDLSDVIYSFELAIDRGRSTDDASTEVVIKYAKKSQLTQYIAVEEMDEIRKQSAAHAAVARAALSVSRQITSASNSPMAPINATSMAANGCDSLTSGALSPSSLVVGTPDITDHSVESPVDPPMDADSLASSDILISADSNQPVVGTVGEIVVGNEKENGNKPVTETPDESPHDSKRSRYVSVSTEGPESVGSQPSAAPLHAS